jgi:hypothetical protein
VFKQMLTNRKIDISLFNSMIVGGLNGGSAND